MSSNNKIYAQNEALALSHLKDKMIIYSVQYISNEDTQIDGDGPTSSWDQSFLCIEKTENDYIFHFFRSDNFHTYSYPYIKAVTKYYPFSQKLSDLQKQFSDILSKSYSDINSFINYWNEDLSFALICNDKDLNHQMKILSSKIDELEIIADEKYKIIKEKQDREYEEYLKSDAYNQYLQDEIERKKKEQEDYEKKEKERLAHLIKMFGEVEGPKYMRL